MNNVLIALAITIHNFPEGLATFLAVLQDSSLGVAIAVALALHNIPEGISLFGLIEDGSNGVESSVDEIEVFYGLYETTHEIDF